jgi:alkanesulfonate monooxygenase SsuD/methylene tetrahydromethanopterin reductase-like flavin-dependent oxidoreductase (luciferase family)
MVGRGSYVESFPLFGYALDDYNDLFAEKLDLLLSIQQTNPITWEGRFRAGLRQADIAPRPLRGTLPIWVAVGGTPASVVRAASYGLPLALAIIGGEWPRFQPFVDLYRKSLYRYGFLADTARISINTPGFIASSRSEALEIAFPYFAAGMMENFHERGRGIAITRDSLAAQSTLDGALFFGGPDETIAKILAQHEQFGHQRFVLQLGFGNVPQRETLRAIELLGREVAPVVRAEIAKRDATPRS